MRSPPPRLVTKAGKDASPDAGIRPPNFSDDDLALRFADQHADDRLYVATWSRWLAWDHYRWAADRTLKAFDDARSICRSAAAECNDLKVAKLLASAAGVAAVERLARSDRRLAATPEQFDANPMIFNSASGVIDLQTGELRPAVRDDFLTKFTGVPLGDRCDRWREFIDQITDGDTQLARYLARMVGYCLTGSTREHAFFFLFGLGANGKTVFTETVAHVLGEYAMAAPIEMFVASRFQGHTTDVAGLQGARFVTASETDAGRALAEARIKLLTGGEKVSARRMRADNSEYVPHFKVVMSGNHKPRISTSDEAIRRRLHLIPFSVTIPPWERDPKLPEKLRAEAPGILRWALDGCLEWQRYGLAPPASVRNATEEYLDAEDVVRSWLTDAVAFDGNSRCTTEELFQSWSAFAVAGREEIGGVKDFVKALEAKGLERRHTKDGNRWIGIAVKTKTQ